MLLEDLRFDKKHLGPVARCNDQGCKSPAAYRLSIEPVTQGILTVVLCAAHFKALRTSMDYLVPHTSIICALRPSDTDLLSNSCEGPLVDTIIGPVCERHAHEYRASLDLETARLFGA